MGYDGLNLIAECDGSNAILRRYVHGPGMDQPLVQYEGSGTATPSLPPRRRAGLGHRGQDASGSTFARNSYDEYGIPGSGNIGRFQYTGQAWMPELGMYHYKARIYSPTLGRFLQTDPIGYADGINWYAYVGNDPVNFVDPLGLEEDIAVMGCMGWRWIECMGQKYLEFERGRDGPLGPANPNNEKAERREKEEENEPKPCAKNTLGTDLRKVGGWASDVGAGAQIVGAALTPFAPEAGAPINRAGALAEQGGDLLSAIGIAVDGDYAGAATFYADRQVSTWTGRRYGDLMKGAWRGAGGRFAKNPLGGKLGQAKKVAAEKAAGKAAGAAGQKMVCGR